MKKTSFAIVLAVLFTLTLTATAQTYSLAKAKIAFGFSVHEQTFAAGTYEVRQLGGGVLRLENVSDHTGVSILVGSAIRQSAGMNLVFHQYGNDYFLREISDPVLGFSAEIERSNAERSAKARQPKETVVAVKASRAESAK
jgi:hypothetical protein